MAGPTEQDFAALGIGPLNLGAPATVTAPRGEVALAPVEIPVARPAPLPRVTMSPDFYAANPDIHPADFYAPHNDPDLPADMALPAPTGTPAPAAPLTTAQQAVNAALAREGAARAARGVAALPLPPGFGPGAGGLYPEDYGSALATAQLQGKLTPAQYAAEKARYGRETNSPRGMLVQQARDAQRQQAIEGEFAAQNIETQRDALERSQVARAQADHAAQIMEQRREQARQVERAELERRSTQLEQLNQELATTKVDPDRYWKNKNGGAALLSMISVALGGFGEGFSGGKLENRGLQMIQQGIDRDIAAQQADLQTKRASIDVQRGLYSLARERFGDNEMAANFARAKMYEQAERAVQGIAMEAKGSTYETAANQLAAQLKYNREQSELSLKLQMAQAAQAAAAASAAQPRGMKAMGDKELERLVPGLNALAPDKETRIKITSTMSAAKTLRETIAAMAELKRTGSTRDPTGTDRARYDALHSNAMTALNVLQGQGAISGADADRVLAGLPKASLTALSTEKDAIALETTGALVDKQARDYVNSQALVPVDYDLAGARPGGGYGPMMRVDPTATAPAPLAVAPVTAGAAAAEPSLEAQSMAAKALAAARRREAMGYGARR